VCAAQQQTLEQELGAVAEAARHSSGERALSAREHGLAQ
jgi:hypothetical protein